MLLNYAVSIYVQTPMTVQGISKSGYLRAQDDSGEEFELHPDSNSLDLMQGMISRKTAF